MRFAFYILMVAVAALPTSVAAQQTGSSTADGADATADQATADERARQMRRERRERREQDGVSGTFRLGAEYDSNALRRELGETGETGESGEGRRLGDGLGRYFLSVDGDMEAGRGSRVHLSLQQGGKLFWSDSEADALLTEVDLGWTHRLGRGLQLSLSAGVKDRLERESRQDYNRGGARVGLAGRAGPVFGRVEGGWQYFAFRPNPASSSHGPLGSATAGVQVADPVRLRAQYTIAHRMFESIRFVLNPEAEVVQRDRSGTQRRDLLHVLRMGGIYRGPLIVEAAYLLLLNRSNSYGQAMTRHGVELDATAPLPWRLYLSVRGRLQWTFYEQPIFLSADFRVDEDNRNALTVSLTRVIGEHWEIEGRYRLFIEEFGAGSDYRRQTGFLGVGYVF